jgi:hypothetical protein
MSSATFHHAFPGLPPGSLPIASNSPKQAFRAGVHPGSSRTAPVDERQPKPALLFACHPGAVLVRRCSSRGSRVARPEPTRFRVVGDATARPPASRPRCCSRSLSNHRQAGRRTATRGGVDLCTAEAMRPPSPGIRPLDRPKGAREASPGCRSRPSGKPVGWAQRPQFLRPTSASASGGVGRSRLSCSAPRGAPRCPAGQDASSFVSPGVCARGGLPRPKGPGTPLPELGCPSKHQRSGISSVWPSLIHLQPLSRDPKTAAWLLACSRSRLGLSRMGATQTSHMDLPSPSETHPREQPAEASSPHEVFRPLQHIKSGRFTNTGFHPR